MDSPMLVGRCVATLGLLVVLCGGCQTTYDCPGGCTSGAYAVIELACPATVTSARLTGPCAPSGDASLFLVESSCTYRGGSGPPASAGFGFACAPITQTPFSGCKEVYLAATAPGVCHVELTFATGFTYSTDVTFTSQTDPEPPGCAQCPPYIGPASQATFMVHNPSNTCVDDAGLNAGADACMDASTEAAAACPANASQSVPCNSTETCAGCRYNAGFECTCASAEGGGLEWQCVDTGFPCAADL